MFYSPLYHLSFFFWNNFFKEASQSSDCLLRWNDRSVCLGVFFPALNYLSSKQLSSFKKVQLNSAVLYKIQSFLIFSCLFKSYLSSPANCLWKCELTNWYFWRIEKEKVCILMLPQLWQVTWQRWTPSFSHFFIHFSNLAVSVHRDIQVKKKQTPHCSEFYYYIDKLKWLIFKMFKNYFRF